MTKNEFANRFKFQPIQDDMQRVNCDQIGQAGHKHCGVCRKHKCPRFMCGCLAKKSTQSKIGANINRI